MADEISEYLDKARRSLANTRAIFAVGVSEDAGRCAYIAALSVAQALFFLVLEKCQIAWWCADEIL